MSSHKEKIKDAQEIFISSDGKQLEPPVKNESKVYTHETLWTELNKLFNLPKQGVKSFSLDMNLDGPPIITLELYAELSEIDSEVTVKKFEVVDSLGDPNEA